MPDLISLSAVFLMGLFGSAHCVGMCGGFSIISRRAGWWPAYGIGKTLTYGVLGALVGLLGHSVFTISGGQRLLSILTGVVLLAVGAATAGLIPDRLALGTRWISRMGPLLGKAMERGRFRGPLTMGALNGLLPCGLVYAALMKSMESAGPLSAAALMTVFGLATLPGLGLLAVFEGRLSGSRRLLLTTSGGWLVMLVGAVTLWRAFQVGAH
jgi:hypothetical protein